MAFEHWYCEKCEAESTVRYKQHAGVTEVRDLISRHHLRKSINCAMRYGLGFVRVGNKPNAQRRSAAPSGQP